MNKRKSKTSTAFSLIELSIVILIVGIIVAGITQGSRLIRNSKLKSAQNLTTSSPVAGIRGISLWLESTQDTSFPESLDDEASLLQWNDSNPQASPSKLFAVPASGVTTSGSTAIKYDSDGINGLPSIRFNGTNTTAGILSLSTSSTTLTPSPVATTADPNNANAFTAFMVYKLDDTASGADYTVLYNGVAASNGWGYFRDSAVTNKRTIQIGTTKALATTSLLTNPEIATITYSGYNASSSNPGTKTTYLYINGGFVTIADNTVSGNNGQATGALATTVVTPTTNLFIGGTTSTTKAWKGLISEIIIFDTVLKNQDLKDVASYLGKKYSIPLQ
jgi:prepilin-type N-terminal cleavage/methylation domain-containing protein